MWKEAIDIFIDKIENNLVMGKGKWLATFTDIYREYKYNNRVFLLYARGDTYEKGFFLSRIFSFFVSPRRKVHLFIDKTGGVTYTYLNNIIKKCLKIGEEDDYILLAILTDEKDIKVDLNKILSKKKFSRIGLSIISTSNWKPIYSNNILGRELKRIIGDLREFSNISYLDLFKSISIVFSIGIFILIVMHLLNIITINLVSFLTWILLSIIIGYRYYKKFYHVTLWLNDEGLKLKRGTKFYIGKWKNFNRVWLHIDGGLEFINLEGANDSVSIPVHKLGLDWRSLMRFIKDRIKKY